MKRFIIGGIVLLVLVILAFSALYFTMTRPHTPSRPFPIILEIPQGSSLSAISRLLHTEDIVRYKWSLRIWVKLHPATPSLRFGRYRFDYPLSLPQLVNKLAQGQVELLKITVREGLTRDDIARQLATELSFSPDEFLAASGQNELLQDIDPDAPDLEGYLAPDTYHVDPGISAADMVRLMVDHFKDKYNRNLQWRARDVGLSNREVVTLASLIEMETANRDERFLISSVFHNRLRLKMRLDCDPTIVYALKRDKLWAGRFSWDNLKYDSPYNTRIYSGLPPGPICSPGHKSIEAALYPEQTDYLFFVAKGGGNHHFSRSLKEHNAAVQQYIIRRNRR